MNAKKIVLITGGIAIALAIFFSLTVRNYKQWENEFGEFKRLEREDFVHSEFSILRVYKGYTYIRVEDGRQFVFNELRNNNYDPPSFYQLIKKCDAILKASASDSIVIYSQRSGHRYWFNLKGDVEKDTKTDNN